MLCLRAEPLIIRISKVISSNFSKAWPRLLARKIWVPCSLYICLIWLKTALPISTTKIFKLLIFEFTPIFCSAITSVKNIYKPQTGLFVFYLPAVFSGTLHDCNGILINKYSPCIYIHITHRVNSSHSIHPNTHNCIKSIQFHK